MALYKNKYRIESARWHNWNYANAAAYYVTICTKDRAHFFGTCVRERMCLNEIGALAWQFWQEIPQHFPHVQLDQFVIMPNHVHGIIIIHPPRRDVALQRLYNYALQRLYNYGLQRLCN